jgi:uncharacterized protein YndB with AHSA1/START domain
MNDLVLSVNKAINAPIEKVFDAWLDAKMLAKFILPMPGMPEPEVKNDPKQGGNFTIIMHVGENDIPHTGEYLEVSRPNKLVFSWVSPFSSDDSIVTIDFIKLADNVTEVKLTHVRFIDEEARSDHEGGWTNILEALNGLISDVMVV